MNNPFGNLIEKCHSCEGGNSAEEQIRYTYDYDNHLIRKACPERSRRETTRYGATITVEYNYDAHGNRVRKTIDGLVTTTYLVDENRDYAQVLEERDGNGDLLVRYVYGYDLISQTRDGATTYYHYDGWGYFLRYSIEPINEFNKLHYFLCQQRLRFFMLRKDRMYICLWVKQPPGFRIYAAIEMKHRIRSLGIF